jgi:U3 small nucleolar RNA-associated protein 6
VRNSASHAGQARTFSIFERGVSRHPASVALWRAYLDFAAKTRASRRWRKIAARALRMHPREAGLWSLAGRRAARNGDMDGARSYFMRGCRFCTAEPALWVDYARSEMEWLSKVQARRAKATKKEGSGPEPAPKISEAVDADGNVMFDEDTDDEEVDEDGLMLPDPDAEFKKDERKVLNDEGVDKLENNPALDGAIPMAIFDIAKKQPFFGAPAAEAFFDVFVTFTNVSSQQKIIEHVLDTMVTSHPDHPSTCNCFVRQPLVGVDPHTAAYPKALRESLARFKAVFETTEDKPSLVVKTLAWIDPVLAVEDLDSGIRTVLEHTRRRLESS